MLPSPIELDQATERREETVLATLRQPTEPTHVAPARRVVGRWFIALGAKLAGEPALRLAGPSRG